MHYAELRAVREELTGPGGQFEIAEEEILGNRIKTFKNQPPSVREFWLSTAAWAAHNPSPSSLRGAQRRSNPERGLLGAGLLRSARNDKDFSRREGRFLPKAADCGT